jgi:hypothetical protein
MAVGEGCYDPDSYHNGLVWLHDNALIACGLRRYGLPDEGIGFPPPFSKPLRTSITGCPKSFRDTRGAKCVNRWSCRAPAAAGVHSAEGAAARPRDDRRRTREGTATLSPTVYKPLPGCYFWPRP